MTLPNPDALARFGTRCFALALLAFGAADFLLGDFVAGRAPAWPAGAEGGHVWAYASAVLFVAAGIAILIRRRGAMAALVSAVMIFVWAVLRHLPLIAADRQLGGAWTNFGKALALSGGALGVAAAIIWSTSGDDDPLEERAAAFNLMGRCALGAFLLLAGLQHYLFADFVKTLVPVWIPGALFWTYVAGGALVAGGIGLVIPQTSRLAAMLVGAMIFTWLLVLHIPRGVAMHNANEWTSVIEALAFSGIAFALMARPRARTP